MNVEVKTPEQQRAELLAKISEFRLMDDTYMSAFFNGRNDLIQFILRIIMNDEKLVVINDKTQKVLKICKGVPLRLMLIHFLTETEKQMLKFSRKAQVQSQNAQDFTAV